MINKLKKNHHYKIPEETRIGELHSVSGEKPEGKVFLLTFHCFGKKVGELEFKGKKLHFKGDAAKSAKLLFDRLTEFTELYTVQRLQLGPRCHKVPVPLNQLKLIQGDPRYFKAGLDSITGPPGDFFYEWFRQAKKPGDKFIVEITKE